MLARAGYDCARSKIANYLTRNMRLYMPLSLEFRRYVAAMAINPIEELASISARLGEDRLLVQGAGGNTSIKCGNIIWIKASGKWLADAEREALFIPLDLSQIRTQLTTAATDGDAVEGAIITHLAPSQLRPSIETTLHAIMSRAVVVHVHCVNSIAWGVQADGRGHLETMLAGLDWAWVPYARPGLPLARLIAKGNFEAKRILILANHGLVIAEDTIGAATTLLNEVTRRLARNARPSPPPDYNRLQKLAAGSDYTIPLHEEVHTLGTVAENLELAVKGTLYPDHVVFLGRAARALKEKENLGVTMEHAEARDPLEAAMLLVPRAGVLVREGLTRNAEEMALCLAHVISRIPAGASLVSLNINEERELVNWDAEKYRKTLNA